MRVSLGNYLMNQLRGSAGLASYSQEMLTREALILLRGLYLCTKASRRTTKLKYVL